MKTNATGLVVLLLLTSTGPLVAGTPRISLEGKWRLQLDREDVGVTERWFESQLSQRVRLPGSLPAQGIGDDVSADTKWMGDIVDRSWFTKPEYARYRQPGNIKVPFWLQPEKYYAGVAWYQCDVHLPASWEGKRVVLHLERPHWATRVWLDGREVGENDSLSTAHEYELGNVRARVPTRESGPSGSAHLELDSGGHQLTIRVDNRLVVDVGVNSHSVSDHTQGNWNGIVGEISLRATALTWIEDLQVFPNLGSRSVRVKGTVGNATGESGNGTLKLLVREVANRSQSNPDANQSPIAVRWGAGGGEFECELPVPSAQPWDEFRPQLFELEARWESGESKTVRFGFRELSAEGTQFALNGNKIFIRGTLECCIFPKTGHPPTDVASWERIIRVAKAHGLNLIRFHSWCPPEAAFEAADQQGFYYQVEIASWANQSTALGDGKPVDAWLYEEAGRILKAYGNHPSFLLMPYGNEPGGQHANEFLARWVNHWKRADPRRFYTSGSGWPELPENQFHVTPTPRIQAWGEGLKSRINARPPETCTDYRDYIRARQVPVISHEIGQWCVYPNFEEIPKYTGYLKPKNFEIFRDSLAAHQMADLAHSFLLASGKLQTLCYKEEIESALRTPGMAGFELLDLHDFPGQGTALVGVLDPFWDSKGYVTPAEYRRFCNSTVPLVRLPKRVFTTAETLSAEVEAAHFGPKRMADARPGWRLVAGDGKTIAEGSFPARDIELGNGVSLGRIAQPLEGVPAPAQYKLVVTVHSQPEGSQSAQFVNDWDIWVYPAAPEKDPDGVVILEEWNEAALARLRAGQNVLFNPAPNRIKGDPQGKVALGFSSIFWNTAWTGHQPPHTLGILCDPRSPALARFPTEYHSNWQWWYLVSRAGAMILDDLPKGLRPTVQVIDDWVTNRKLGLLFEARVGEGRLMVCSIDLRSDLETNPVVRQFRHSVLQYMVSSKFKPTIELTPAQIQSLLD